MRRVTSLQLRGIFLSCSYFGGLNATINSNVVLADYFASLGHVRQHLAARSLE